MATKYLISGGKIFDEGYENDYQRRYSYNDDAGSYKNGSFFSFSPKKIEESSGASFPPKQTHNNGYKNTNYDNHRDNKSVFMTGGFSPNKFKKNDNRNQSRNTQGSQNQVFNPQSISSPEKGPLQSRFPNSFNKGKGMENEKRHVTNSLSSPEINRERRSSSDRYPGQNGKKNYNAKYNKKQGNMKESKSTSTFARGVKSQIEPPIQPKNESTNQNAIPLQKVEKPDNKPEFRPQKSPISFDQLLKQEEKKKSEKKKVSKESNSSEYNKSKKNYDEKRDPKESNSSEPKSKGNFNPRFDDDNFY